MHGKAKQGKVIIIMLFYYYIILLLLCVRSVARWSRPTVVLVKFLAEKSLRVIFKVDKVLLTTMLNIAARCFGAKASSKCNQEVLCSIIRVQTIGNIAEI